jgi:hypothetical protein
MRELLGEVWALVVARKKAFLFPLLVILLMVGGLLIVAEGSVVAPFIYALF